jgi:hypothetical protein|tara:strand:+ start:151 stop:1002 length:852 start_codon:yes stop_codon:yes gene_type:complete
MPRKITSGKVGGPLFGNLSTGTNVVSSVETNANIVFTPNGTGVTEYTKDLYTSGNAGIRFGDSDTNYALIKAPSSLSGNYTLTLPTDDGTAAQALTTDGSGVLSWGSPAVSVVNQTADSSTYYPALSAVTSGTTASINVSDSKLSFVPSTGVLSSTELRSTSSTASTSTSTGSLVVTGGVGVGGQVTAVSIVETSSITLKENINPIQNALDSILQLRGVTYDRLDSNEYESGLIAEWTETVLPELVTRDIENNVVGIKYTKLTAYLIEAIKTLKTEIDALKGR